MTPTESKAFINQWIRNSAVDAFTNSRLNTILLQLVTGGITDTFDNLAAFRQAILDNRAANQDWYMRARMDDTDDIYEYWPPRGEYPGRINQTASQLEETI